MICTLDPLLGSCTAQAAENAQTLILNLAITAQVTKTAGRSARGTGGHAEIFYKLGYGLIGDGK